MHIKKKWYIILYLCLGLYLGYTDRLFATTSGYDKDGISPSGPIPVRNQMPLYLFFMQMAPDKASTLEKGKLSINADYIVSNISVSAFTPATSLYDIQIDMEVSRITLDFRYGLCDKLEVGLEIPYIGFSSGYLDDFVEDFEDTINARTPRSRQRQGSFELDYTFKYDYNYLIQAKTSKKGIGDIIASSKYQLFEDGIFNCWVPNLSFRAAVKFPTADKDDLLGSGKLDYGCGFLLDKAFLNKKLFVYFGGNMVHIKKPEIFNVLDMDKKIYSYFTALEYFLTKRFSLITEISGNTTPYPHSDTNPLDNDAHEWTIGFNYNLKHKTEIYWNFAVVENIRSASSPDVSFCSGIEWRF